MGEPISFKSVGQTHDYLKNVDDKTKQKQTPFGIVTPLRYGSEGGSVFAMHTSAEKQFSDNLKNLLLTNHGERLGLHDFGANLRPLMVEYSSGEGFDEEAMLRIRTTTQKYMPYVELETFEIVVDHTGNEHTGKVKMRITWGIPALSIVGKKLELVFYVT